MKALLQFLTYSSCLLGVACSNVTSTPAVSAQPTPAKPRTVFTAPTPIGANGASRTQSTGASTPSKPTSNVTTAQEDDAEIKLGPLSVKAAPLTGYVLVHEVSRNILTLRDAIEAPPEATDGSIIWGEAGYWGSQIVAIDGVEVSSLSGREWYRMIFRGADPVRLTVVARSRRLVVIDAFTTKTRRPNKTAEATP